VAVLAGGLVVVGGTAVTAAPGYADSAESAFTALAREAGEEVSPPRAGQAREENAVLARLAASAEKAAARIVSNTWQLPISRGGYRLTARFGECSSLWSHCHTGLDLAAREGTGILSVASGVVSEVGWAGAYGNRTVVTLDDGTEIWYCHQSQFGVEQDQTVVGGQTIGFVGATGNTTGPHLHLEVRPGGGDPVDPERAFSVRGERP